MLVWRKKVRVLSSFLTWGQVNNVLRRLCLLTAKRTRRVAWIGLDFSKTNRWENIAYLPLSDCDLDEPDRWANYIDRPTDSVSGRPSARCQGLSVAGDRVGPPDQRVYINDIYSTRCIPPSKLETGIKCLGDVMLEAAPRRDFVVHARAASKIEWRAQCLLKKKPIKKL